MHAGRAFISPLPPEVNIRHFELYRESVAEDRPIVELESRPDKSYLLTVIGRERNGLLADLTNYLESVRLNVVQARIFSLPNDSIMDMFHLTDPHKVLASDDAARELHDSLFRLIGVRRDDQARTAPPTPVRREQWIDALATARPVTSNIARRQTSAMRRCLSNIVLSQVDRETTVTSSGSAPTATAITARSEAVVRDAERRMKEGEWFYTYSQESLQRYRFKYSVSADRKYLCWGDSYSVRLSHCVGVVFGPHSNVFREVGSARIEPDWMCFSLVSFPPASHDEPAVPRTYDFVCVDDAQLECWLLGLQSLCRPHDTAQLYTLSGLILQRARFKIRAHAHARKLTTRQYVLKRARECGERRKSQNAVIKRDEEVAALEERVRNMQAKLQDAARRETVLNTTLLNVQAGWETSISEVTLVETIGKGAYSEMWRGLWRSTPVAVKLLKPNSDVFCDELMTNGPTTPGSSDTMAGSGSEGTPGSDDMVDASDMSRSRRDMPSLSDADQRLLREFHEEVTTLSKLRHPNIVLFMAACARPPQLCIITEFCHGGSLFGALRRRSWRERLSLNDLVVIARHIARGMRFLHACSIIHRDLKSQNILLDRNVEEGCPVVKIADFGLSRKFKQGAGSRPAPSNAAAAAGDTAGWSTKGIMTSETGTYRWMSPEVIRHEPYNQKVDVYSYGVVVWELFACEIPFFGMTPIQAAFAVADKNLRPSAVSEYGKAMPIPVGWMELIQRCWHPSPDFRPRFKDIVQALDEMDKGKADKMTAYWRNWDEAVAVRRRMRREANARSAATANTPPGANHNRLAFANGARDAAVAETLSRLQRGNTTGTATTTNTNATTPSFDRNRHQPATGRQTTGLGHSGSAPNLRRVAKHSPTRHP